MSELCVLQNLKKVEYDPWPYIIIENALPEKVHNELLQTLPNDRLDKQQQVDQHGKLTWLLKELHEEQYPVSNIWKEFIEYHTSKQFVDKVFDAFEKKSKNLAIPRDQLIKADINNAGRGVGLKNALSDQGCSRHRRAAQDHQVRQEAGSWVGAI